MSAVETAEAASGSGMPAAEPASATSAALGRGKKSMSELLARVTSEGQGSKLSAAEVDDFFRAELWRPEPEPRSFQHQVLDRAADLAPSSSAAPPAGPVTPPRRGRRVPVETPSPPPAPPRGRKGQPVAEPASAKRKRAKPGKGKGPASPGHRLTAKSPMPKSILKKASPKRQIEKPNTLQKSTPRQIAKLRQLGALARVPVDAFASPESHVMKVEPETLGGRPKRQRMPPLQSWRNERVVYERTTSSRTPRVVAVELDMARASQAPYGMRLPALQLPLSDIEASEFAGITTKKMQSKVYQLPSQASSTTGLPCTIELCGPGVIHVLEGSLRFAKETDKKEKMVDAGTTILLKDASSHLLAPADKDGESSGVRFFWVGIR